MAQRWKLHFVSGKSLNQLLCLKCFSHAIVFKSRRICMGMFWIWHVREKVSPSFKIQNQEIVFLCFQKCPFLCIHWNYWKNKSATLLDYEKHPFCIFASTNKVYKFFLSVCYYLLLINLVIYSVELLIRNLVFILNYI